MGDPLGRLPSDVSESTMTVDPTEFNNLFALARALQKTRGANGIRVSIGAGGVAISNDSPVRPAGVAAPLNVVQVRLRPGTVSPGPSGKPTYDAYKRATTTFEEEDLLATSLSPEYRPLDDGNYIAAPAESMGEAYKLEGTWHLIAAYGEKLGTFRCNPAG